MKRSWFSWLIGSLVAGLVGAAPAPEVRVVGTDLLGKEFFAVVNSGARYAGTNVVIALDGSRPGLGRLKSNWADIALLSLPAAEAAQLSAYHVEPLAYHCVWVLVAEECPLQEISLAELAGIFGGERKKTARTWAVLSGAAAWSERPLVALAPEAGAGMTAEYFRGVALGGGVWREDVERYRNEEELVARLAREPGAIVLARSVPANAKVRAVPVAARAGEAATLPTPAALHAGRYPLCLPLHLVIPHARKEMLAAWIAWWRSSEPAEAFARAGLVPRLHER